MGADTLRKNWLASLAHERRASPHTLRAYGDDVSRFIGFQAGHLGGTVNEKALAKLTPADIRAFITARRQEGLGPGGVQRALAAVRSFYKFLAKEGVLENAAARSIRTPRFTYIAYPDGTDQLFAASDTRERDNLADDPAHAATLAEMKRRLEQTVARASRGQETGG